MENALLIGLSRQTTLERQLDVISNNIANVNTTGYKADQSLFEEYLTSGAHEDQFVGKDRKVSFVQDRGTYRDYSQGALQQTGNPLDVAIDGEGFLAVQSAGGERYTRDGNLQVNAQGQLTPGQFGRVRLIGSAPYEALLIPDSAIATDQSRKIVFVVKDDNSVEARPVELGPLDDGLRVIRTGLKPEDRVIIDGIQRARIGAKVSPQAGKIAGDKT